MTTPRFKISRVEIERIKDAARALPKQPKQQLSRQEAIEELEDTLVHMERELALPLSEILQFLADMGLPMSASTLQGYRRKSADQKAGDPKVKVAKRTKPKAAINVHPGDARTQLPSEASQGARDAASGPDTSIVATPDPVPSAHAAPQTREPAAVAEPSVAPVTSPEGTPDVPSDVADVDARFLANMDARYAEMAALNRQL